jgi:hypothetical protein
VSAFTLKEALIKELKETFTKQFQEHPQTSGSHNSGARGLMSFLGKAVSNKASKLGEIDGTNPPLIKEVLEDEVILNDWLTLD